MLLSTGCMDAAEAQGPDLDALADGMRQGLEMADVRDESFDAPSSVECYDPEDGPVDCVAHSPWPMT